MFCGRFMRLDFVQLVEIIVLALVYFLTAKLGQLFAMPPGNVTPLWIPSGLILAAVLLRGYWIWPGVFLGAFMGNVSAYIDLQSGSNILSSLFAGSMNGFGDSLGAVLGAWIIIQFTRNKNPLHMSGHVAVFLLAGAVLSALISACFGVTSLAIAGFIEWESYAATWLTWSVGDGVGVLIITPLILSLQVNQHSQLKSKRKAEALVYMAIMFMVVSLSLDFFQTPLSYQLPLFFVAPLLIWSVLRLSEKITFLSIVTIAVIAATATTKGIGPFVQLQAISSLLQLQLFIAAMSISILVLNAVVMDRKKINHALQRAQKQLESLVEERTQKLSDALRRERELNRGLEQTTSELKLTQKQLLHSQKIEALGTLAGGIAHDFNNILNVIIGNADLAESKIAENHPIQKNLNSIVSSGNRAAKLVKQILTFSRIKPDYYCAMNLSEVVADAIKMTRSTIPANVEINCKIEDENITINGDVTQIHQIILNLCTNAYHAMFQNEGVIEICLKKDQSCPIAIHHKDALCALLSISDNGSGMHDDVVARIFDPFFTTKEVGKGTGLGLSVVHGIVDSHKGVISVDSQPGQGTRFDIYLPISSEEVSAPPNKLVSTVNAQNRTILLVDDEAEIVNLYQQFFQTRGQRVFSALDPLDALQLFKDNLNEIDLVITDQSMPHMTGRELAEKLLVIKPGLKIILMTGYSDVIDEAYARQLGICDFLEKPVKLDALLTRIEACFHSLDKKANTGLKN